METRSANEFNEAKTEHINDLHLWQSNIGWYECIVEVYKLMEKNTAKTSGKSPQADSILPILY